MMKNIKPLHLTAACLILIGSANAAIQVVGLYDFDDGTLDSGVATGGTMINPLGLAISNQHSSRESAAQDSLVLGTPLSGNALVGRYSDINNSSSLDFAIANDQYLSFTITPQAGTTIDLDSFRMDMDITGGGGLKYAGLFWDEDGFIVEGDSITGKYIYDPSDANGDQPGESITRDLSVLGLPTITSATEFRVYFVAAASTGSHGFALDNITLSGDVIVAGVPEPSSIALLCLGGLALVLRRRK